MSHLLLVLLCLEFCNAQTTKSPRELLKEAVELQQAGKLDEAIRDYRDLLDMYPNAPEVRSNLGAALAGKGRYTEAIAEYNRALLDKPDPQVRWNLALAYEKIGQLSRAVDVLKKLHEESPANLNALTLLADCHLRLGQNQQVIDLLDGFERTSQSSLAIDYMLGSALVREGQTARGQLIIERILKNGDSAEARLLMGTTKYMINDFSGALIDLRKAVELKPDMPDVYSYYGLALLSTGDQNGAKKAFERELEFDPNNFEANLRMGVLLRQDDDNVNALPFFRHALDLRPADPGVRYQIAALELAQGEVDLASRDLESLIKEVPRFTEAHVSLATAYYRQKRKADGDRERAIVAQLNAARQSAEPAGKAQ